MADNVPLVLPPLLSPANDPRPPRIRIRHPGYKEFMGENILLELPTVDYIVEPSSQVRTCGLHHGTAIIACGIIANNAFNDAYLSYDAYGKKPVETSRDNMLKPGDYWLQLTGKEPPTDIPSNREGTKDGTEDGTEPRAADSKEYKYPIVPSFRDWQFPHGKLPNEWQQPHNPPQPASTNAYDAAQRCIVTDLRIGLEHAHIVPSTAQEWFNQNDMGAYCNISTGAAIDDNANEIWLMAHIHASFNNRLFVIVPKPSAGSSRSANPPAASLNSDFPLALPAEPRPYAFATHVLSTTPEARDFAHLYQNVSIQTQYINALSPEFLFARFAWALFPYLRKFILESKVRRHLIVIEQNEVHPKHKWMNSQEYKTYQAKKSNNASGSRKRQGPSNQDGELDDAYEERQKRYSTSRERGLFDYDWENSDHGRSRHRDMWSESDTDTGAEDLPGLSHSFSTTGSNEGIVEIDPSEEPQARQNRSLSKHDASTYTDRATVIE
ncbi:hypothetical protein F5Y12DRAFT_738602 [Xylaria sp. FL1777]|nr:hypothetical protein F5Y12DRAFT_738602 [Xylaria sp. FL1777]